MTSSAAALVERRGRSPEPPGERALLMLGGAFGGEFHWCGDPWGPEWRAGAGCRRCSEHELTARRFFAGRDLAWAARRKAGGGRGGGGGGGGVVSPSGPRYDRGKS